MRTVHAIVAFIAPNRAKQRLLDSVADVVGDITQEALKRADPGRVVDSLSAQPVIIDSIVLVLEVLGRDVSTKFFRTFFLELGQRAHELLPQLSEKARTWVRATMFLGAEVMNSPEASGTTTKDVINEIRANKLESRRLISILVALLGGGSVFGISEQLGDELALELWRAAARGIDEELVEDCYWTAAHIEAKAAA